MRLASRFGYAANQIRRDRPLTHEELIRHVPSIFGKTGTPPAVNGMRTFPPLPSWKICSGRLSAVLRLPDPCARPGRQDTQNTCCVCGGTER